MTLVVEDGTGFSDADAYVSIQEVTDYLADYQLDNSLWVATLLAAQEVHIRLATRYIDAAYEVRMKGHKLNNVQALGWPRHGATDYAGFLIPHTPLPTQLKDAAAIVADLSRSGEVLLPTIKPGEGQLERKTIRTGDLLVTREWGSTGNTVLPTYSEAERVIAELLHSVQGMVLRG